MDIEKATEQWRNREAELEIPRKLNQWGFDVLTAWAAAHNEANALREENAAMRKSLEWLRAKYAPADDSHELRVVDAILEGKVITP